jgi:superfamily II DNA/RNA helicase
MSKENKLRINEDFSRVEFIIRILCAIDVMGLGINIVDVNVIIQWKLPPSLRELMQRAERSTRDQGRDDELIWFYPTWCKRKRVARAIRGLARDAERSQLSQITNVSDMNDSNSETKVNENERIIQERKRQVDKKTAIEKRAQMKDVLWRVINESSEFNCIRDLILGALNESNISKSTYRHECCSICTSSEGFTSQIKSYRQSSSRRSRTNASIHVRTILEKTLKKWRDEQGPNEFENSVLVQGHNYEVFLGNDIIKNIVENAHLMKTVNDFRSLVSSWPSRWLNKYVVELTELVVRTVTSTKKNKNYQQTTRRLQKVESNQQTNRLAREVESSDVAAPLSLAPESFSNNDDISITSSTTRIMKNLWTPQSRSRRKRQGFVMKDIGSSLRSRNASSFMRGLISQELEIDQATGRPRRDSAIRSDIARKNNLNLLRW